MLPYNQHPVSSSLTSLSSPSVGSLDISAAAGLGGLSSSLLAFPGKYQGYDEALLMMPTNLRCTIERCENSLTWAVLYVQSTWMGIHLWWYFFISILYNICGNNHFMFVFFDQRVWHLWHKLSVLRFVVRYHIFLAYWCRIVCLLWIMADATWFWVSSNEFILVDTVAISLFTKSLVNMVRSRWYDPFNISWIRHISFPSWHPVGTMYFHTVDTILGLYVFFSGSCEDCTGEITL